MASKKSAGSAGSKSSGVGGVGGGSGSGIERYQITDGLQLCIARMSAPAAVASSMSTHHLVVLDCSGSMASDIPALREQLKTKLATLIEPGDDVVSVVWFSGRGECGSLFEAAPVKDLKDLTMLQKGVDKWIRPVGLTGFVDPLKLGADIIRRLNEKAFQKKGPTFRHSLIFMSDGCDNQWERHEIISAAQNISLLVQAATFVEYGYYADKLLLSQMAAKCSGRSVFASDFAHYEPEFRDALRSHAAPRVPVKLQGDVIARVAFAIGDDGVSTFEVGSDSVAMVPEHARTVYYLAPGTGGGDVSPHINVGTLASAASDGGEIPSALYAALSVLATRGLPEVILPVLSALGDVALAKRFTGLFGKQAYSAFQVDTARLAVGPAGRVEGGFQPGCVPAEDAFTVMDLLTLLQKSHDDCRILFDHPSFKYTRIGRKRVDAHDEEATGVAALKFVYEPDPDGTPCNALVLNEDRANVSVNVKRKGYVDLSGRLPEGIGPDAVPLKFPSHQFRSYSIIKDGLVNVARLPLVVDSDTMNKLMAEGVPHEVGEKGALVIKLDEMPIMDRRDLGEISAAALCREQHLLELLRCAQKVYKKYRDDVAPEKVDVAFAAKYGEVAAKWLADNGFDSYKGYAPKHTKQADAKGDYYLAKLVTVSIPGFGKLPSVADAAAGKGGTAGKQMALTITECEAKKKSMDAPAFARWVAARAESTIMEVRDVIVRIARMKFAVIVGQKWFPEFPQIGEGVIQLNLGPTLGNKTVDVSFQMKEERVEL